jgi:Uma2 family endonuclease
MSSQPKTFLTQSEYLDLERRAEFKSEYYNGEMFAMAGANPRHVDIVTNLVGELRQLLKKRPCHVYSVDLRLRVAAEGMYTYPDVMVACEPIEFADDQADTLLNPSVIIEVLSQSTRSYDHIGTFEHYRTLPSLSEYLLVAQHMPHIEQYVRQPENRWLLTEFKGLDQSFELPSIGCVLALSEVYDKVEWPAA